MLRTNPTIKFRALYLESLKNKLGVDIYNEGFQETSSKSVMSSFISLLEKRLGEKFYGGKFSYKFSKGGKSFKGLKYIIGKGNKAIRINTSSSGGSSQVEQIDFWTRPDKYPHFTMNCQGFNLVQLVDVVAKTIKSPKAGQIPVEEKQAVLTEDIYDEARKNYEAMIRDWMREENKKLSGSVSKLFGEYSAWASGDEDRQMSYGSFNLAAKSIAAGSGGKTVTVSRGGDKETVPAMPELSKVMKEVTAKMTTSEIFDQVEAYVDQVKQGVKSGLLITGSAGSGKSYSTKQHLKGTDHRIFKGTIKSAINLYQALYENNVEGFITVFDDCDQMLYDKESLSILKAALETGEDERKIDFLSQDRGSGEIRVMTDDGAVVFYNRERQKLTRDQAISLDANEVFFVDNEGKFVTRGRRNVPVTKENGELKKNEHGEWVVEGNYPKSFIFVGKVIFISNLAMREMDRNARAILSRVNKVDVDLDVKQMIERIQKIAPKLKELQNVPEKAVKDAIEYMWEVSEYLKGFDIRTFIDVVANRLTGHPAWKKWSWASITAVYGSKLDAD